MRRRGNGLPSFGTVKTVSLVPVSCMKHLARSSFLQILYGKLPIAQTCRVFVEGESG